MRSNGRMRRLTLALLVLASCGVRDDGANAKPSSSATTSASATVSATATPTPTATDASRYGYVVSSQGRFVVAAEGTGSTVLAIDGEGPVASHDGRHIAYWRAGPRELHIVDVPGGADRLL